MAGLAPKLPISRSEIYGYSLLGSLEEIAAQNLKMLILTSPGERIMEPGFGVGLRRYLFANANASTFNEIETKIVDQAQIYIPYIIIQSVQFLPVTSGNILENSDTTVQNYIHIRVTYAIPDIGLVTALQLGVS